MVRHHLSVDLTLLSVHSLFSVVFCDPLETVIVHSETRASLAAHYRTSGVDDVEDEAFSTTCFLKVKKRAVSQHSVERSFVFRLLTRARRAGVTRTDSLSPAANCEGCEVC